MDRTNIWQLIQTGSRWAPHDRRPSCKIPGKIYQFCRSHTKNWGLQVRQKLVKIQWQDLDKVWQSYWRGGEVVLSVPRMTIHEKGADFSGLNENKNIHKTKKAPSRRCLNNQEGITKGMRKLQRAKAVIFVVLKRFIFLLFLPLLCWMPIRQKHLWIQTLKNRPPGTFCFILFLFFFWMSGHKC